MNGIVEVEAVEYRAIPGHPGYRIGNDGSVWSLWLPRGQKSVMGEVWRLKKAFRGKNGYLYVNLQVSGKPKHFYLQRLILETFVGPQPEGMEACHNDGDKSNNAPSNLRWDTRKNNHVDKKSHGTDPAGIRHGMHKATEEDVRNIRAEFADGRSRKALAEKYRLSRSNISLIVTMKAWRHLDPGA